LVFSLIFNAIADEAKMLNREQTATLQTALLQ